MTRLNLDELIAPKAFETLSCCPPYVFEVLAEGFASPPPVTSPPAAPCVWIRWWR